ncbi:vomeronasal type-2 receptor 26-like [Anomaloglossus baeobatrachus]|uniref:vomeronasal type-2 receptor 26-like n=1 Tax=Anomaloglossus baeobatrachus TaxID=238106 RepID=UPI003F508C2D
MMDTPKVEKSVAKLKFLCSEVRENLKNAANFREYRHLLTFIFAINDINNDPTILPNITLGYHLYDSCGNVNKVIKDVLQIMSGHSVTAPNYSCMDHGNLAGYIGDQGSATSLPMAQLLGMYGYTQVSYGARDSILSDRRLYPHFFRTVQDNEMQSLALVKLLLFFNWNFVIIFATNDDIGERELRFLSSELTKSGICIEKIFFLTHAEILHASEIKNLKAEVILLCGTSSGLLRHYMKLLCINDPKAEKVCFNDKGEIPETLEILNFITELHDNATGGDTIEGLTATVGSFDGSRTPDQQLNISSLDILWVNNKMPYSRCSEECFPGKRKAVIKGHHTCCYDCILCSNGEVSNKSDAENCDKCFYTEWPNEARDKCIPKVVEFLSYDTDVVAYVFLFLLVLSSTTILLIIGIFTFFWNSPVVRANNRNLSFIILVSLKLSLLCILLFIGKPVDTTCMLRHICFGIIFTVVLSSVLAKTIMVCIAFKATTPGSSWRKWIGVKLPNSIVMILSSLQVLNGILWLSLSPPFQEIDVDSTPGKIIIQCNEGSRLAFYFMLGYMGFLAVMSLILAFMVRKLPDIYNEAKYITFSMLVFCCVWICAIPAYLSSKGKNMVSVEVFAIMASGNGIMICIFLPKLWNILKKSEMKKSNLLEK